MRDAANKCECGADAEDISFDRRICACGSLHYYCNQCGTRAEPCADERPDAHCEQNAITETSQRGLGYQSGEPAGAVNSGSAPANAASLHVLRVPEEEYRDREPEKVRWCFKCRARLLHWLVFVRPIDPMSYYGPRIDLRCEGCGEDNADFPGIFRDGPRYDFVY